MTNSDPRLSADSAALSAKWRIQAKQLDDSADELFENGHDDDGDLNAVEANTLRRCADEIERISAISNTSSDGGVENQRHAARGLRTPKTAQDGQEGGPLGSAPEQGHPEEHVAGVVSGPSDQIPVDAQTIPEIAAYRWRFLADSEWSRWIMLDPDQIDAFRNIQDTGLESGSIELQPLYASQPPAAPVETATKSAPCANTTQKKAERLPSSDAAGMGADTLDLDDLQSELTDTLKPQGELRPLCLRAAEAIAQLRRRPYPRLSADTGEQP